MHAVHSWTQLFVLIFGFYYLSLGRITCPLFLTGTLVYVSLVGDKWAWILWAMVTVTHLPGVLFLANYTDHGFDSTVLALTVLYGWPLLTLSARLLVLICKLIICKLNTEKI